MRQVLFHIPHEVSWLPEGLPFSVFLLLVAVVVAVGLVMASSRYPKDRPVRENLRTAAFGIVIIGVALFVALRYFQDALPNGIPIYGFGMMLFLAFLICTGLASWRGEREGVKKEIIQDLALWLFIGGLIGARSLYLWQQGPPLQGPPLERFWSFIKQLPQIWEGGIILYGAVAGALVAYAVGYVLIFRKHGLSTLKFADIAAPSMAVGLCLGRIGCFLNGCCYGEVACADCPVYAVHFPLSAPPRADLVGRGYQTAAGFTLLRNSNIVERVEPDSAASRSELQPGDAIIKADNVLINNESDLANYLSLSGGWPRGKNDLTLEVQRNGEDGDPLSLTFSPRTIGLHPTQLYETISMALLFLVLTAYYPFRTRDGQVMVILMIGYGMHRFLNEQLRIDKRPEGIEEYTSLVLIAAGIALGLWLWKRPAQYKTSWTPEPKK
jgi:phosphatidylglycerol:prolipoprotein diacylglycerol transferase